LHSMNRFAATGFSYGPTPDPHHARIAVTSALRRSGQHAANGVLLFLTPGYIEPVQALREASRAAGCLQITGCHGESLMTEDEWLLEVGSSTIQSSCPMWLTRLTPASISVHQKVFRRRGWTHLRDDSVPLHRR